MKKTILCFGDSNTHGYQAETGGRFNELERFPRLLEEYLGPNYLVQEEGMSGRTTVFEDPLIAPAPIEEGYQNTFVFHEMGRGCVEKSRQLAFYYKQTAELLATRLAELIPTLL